MRLQSRLLMAIVAMFAATFVGQVHACTRAVYLGDDGTVITGRSMDWMADLQSNLWAFPRGITRNGAAGPTAPVWTSKYGSVIATTYDVGTIDGMNEKGLVANLLYLAESEYGKPDGRPAMSISVWGQYVLDNYATVAEAVSQLSQEPFRIAVPVMPGAPPARLHLAISDSTGDSAIFEYVGGKLVIHHGRQYQVMTNSPQFSEQLALNAYWERVGGLTFLPGTSQAADRFVRTSFYIRAIPRTTDKNYISAVPGQSYNNQAIASTMSVLRSVGTPLGITTPEHPNIASTIWRTVADHKNGVYFFDSATSPNTFWVNLKDLDFAPGAPVRKLTVSGGRIYSGNTAGGFEVAKPFEFLKADPIP